MTNFEAIKELPEKVFSNMVFNVVKNDCETLKDFEDFLQKEIKSELEPTLKEALQKIQCSSTY